MNYFVARKQNDPVVLWLPSGLLANISVLQPSPFTPQAINILFSLSRRQNILKNSVSKFALWDGGGKTAVSHR